MMKKSSLITFAMLATLAWPLAGAVAEELPALGPVSGPSYGATDRLGATLPANSSGQGEPEPVNGLPPGFENGTVAMTRHEELQRYRAQEAERAPAPPSVN